MTDTDHGIAIYDLHKQFKSGPKAIDGISLTVAGGQIYGFLGPNGAGKSTTVLVLTTLLPPDGGRATVHGYDVAKQGAQVRASIGAALQEAALDPMLTGREHMRLQTALQGLPRAVRRARGDELLERVGLTSAADRRVNGYSGGMKRRLDLALALVHRPRVLFLDEPTTGLDPQSRSDLWQEVSRLAREEGVTVFLTTQYLEEADALADDIGIINHGRIVAEGTPEALKAEIGRPTLEVVPADPADRQRFIDVLTRFGPLATTAGPQAVAVHLDDGPDALASVIRGFDSEALRMDSFQVHKPTLDDVFLAKTGESFAQQEQGAAAAVEGGSGHLTEARG